MKNVIQAKMTLLDIVSEHEETIEVFQRYDEQAGVCLCCTALFDSVEAVAKNFALDLPTLISDLNQAINQVTDQA